ncbi:uncharacterized protein Z519_01038 [Cladophialophora bantiana CBS 173.52]|uniref:Uncharacterized protein n=1 Tax=Cladophialophora bantiana (strain ATCC 10958 / CBS 173.52 / CDC B-1940 / NIH 8579) TaxID=1442370 RepID=A0A0D2IKZ5_CLAB1|nr:uncharacterized protein Z519_01038 [Cladophialophora bantiana CBS 173.52]KIW97454.1 hypothetical protein Z519_01038 [Cladophialophora bantiana CBS 173.52]
MTTATTSTSAVQGFSLFPTTVPKIAIPNPHKKNPSLHSISIVTSPDSTFSPNAESVVIKMEEERPPVPRFPARLSEQQQTRESTPSPEDIGRAVTTSSPIDGKTPTQPVLPSATVVTYTPSLYQSPELHQSSSPQPSSSLGTGSATTLVAAAASTANIHDGTHNKSPTDPSPVVPIRSIFPVYNPSVPLTQQVYLPHPPPPVRISGMPPFNGIPLSREDYRSSLSIPFNTPAVVAAQRTAPASVLNFPSDVMSINVGPRISTQRELEKLWDASHGTEPGCSIKSFDLEMARTEEATFVFGSHPSLPFYTLQTYDTNEIAISKTCPSKPRSPTANADTPLTRDVILCPLEPAARRLPPNDGLVAFIFPKLAALLAINQSAALARQHSLAPTDRDDIEAQAVRRAAKQEACHLRFNARGGFYELEHPAIGRAAMGGDFATQSPVPSSPTTIRSITGKPVLHITISTDSHLPTINVIDPNAARRIGAVMTPTTTAPSSAGAGMRRLSTLPLTETPSPSSEYPPLATLDLTSEILHVDANAILELMPSLFSVDCVVSAVMSVAVADAATNPILGGMEIWKPRPAPTSRLGIGARSIRTRAGSVRSYAGSAFYATIAEREEAEEEAKLMRRTHEADIREASGSSRSKPKGSRIWFGRLSNSTTDESEEDETLEKKSRKRKNKKTKTKKIVVGEFDLEKLGHYQSGDRKGEELPAVTRGVLGGLVMGLKLVVWLLTMVVQVLAWLLVHLTRGLTSEKF